MKIKRNNTQDSYKVRRELDIMSEKTTFKPTVTMTRITLKKTVSRDTYNAIFIKVI